MTKIKDDQDLMYGLEEMYLKGLSIGYIKEDSFQWNGTQGELAQIRAAQVKGTAIKNIPTSNGTVAPTFQLLQFNYENMAKVLGGRVIMKNGKAVGWAAPKALVRLEGFVEVFSDSGQVIVFPSAIIQGFISGPLQLTETSTIDCTLGVNQPATGEDPYYIFDAAEYTPYDATANTPPTLPKGDATEMPAGTETQAAPLMAGTGGGADTTSETVTTLKTTKTSAASATDTSTK